MNIANHAIAVCSWSLQPRGMLDLVEKMEELELQHVQLALADMISLDDKRKHEELGRLCAAGIQFTGGMLNFAGEDYSTIDQIRKTGGYVPDAEWPLRKRISMEGARLARELGMSSVMAHIGFVPPKGKAGYETMIGRVRELAGAFADHGISLLMETGQEPAAELLHFLHDLACPNVHINFDPANMILYGAGDPIEAIGLLGPHIRHVHVKDALASNNPGKDWGTEVPFGCGQVGAARFLAALKQAGYTGPLAIEREAGDQRVKDIQFAKDSLWAAAP